MDTDDLSIQTYNGIILESEKFNHDLTLQFGILASICSDDDDYLNQSEILIRDWLANDNFDIIADDIFFGETVNLNAFREALEKILANIAEISKTPKDNREYENW